jgi:hypothetical protein
MLIQGAAPSRAGLAELPLPALVREASVDYRPRPDDPAQLLGVVIYAMGPI